MGHTCSRDADQVHSPASGCRVRRGSVIVTQYDQKLNAFPLGQCRSGQCHSGQADDQERNCQV